MPNSSRCAGRFAPSSSGPIPGTQNGMVGELLLPSAVNAPIVASVTFHRDEIDGTARPVGAKRLLPNVEEHQ
eukprot:11210203-Lingulodinium_polyedra.AAC.1